MGIEIGSNYDAASSNLSATALTGSRQSLERLNKAAERIQTGDVSIENMVTLIQEPIVYTMNMKVIQVSDEMAGQLMNLRA
jgi:flagellar basal body rod protein FlgG